MSVRIGDETEALPPWERVQYDPPITPGTIIGPCCAADTRQYLAVPSIRMGADGEFVERGYALFLEHRDCGCPARWIPHNWGRGHAKFETRLTNE